MKSKALSRFLVWRIKHISNKNFVYILSGIIGVVSGFAAVVLKWSVLKIHHYLEHNVEDKLGVFYFLVIPIFGIFVTSLLANYVFKEVLGHGVSNILYAISKGSSVIKIKKAISRMATSFFTVGFGGSVGLEAPIVATGSAIGASIAKEMHLNYKKRTLLIGCGAAACISAVFNSPIAGVIFSIEVILVEVAISKFIPLLIASFCGVLVSMSLLGGDFLFSLEKTEKFIASDVLYYVGLGVFCGFLGVYFTRITYFTEGAIEKIKNTNIRALVGGTALGCMIMLFPPLFGEGYNTIDNLVNNRPEQLIVDNVFLFEGLTENSALIIFMVLLIIFKAIASALTIGSGGSGGIFAPTLMVGSIAGYLYASVFNNLGAKLWAPNFALVGMCGVMSSIQHAPLSAIFLIAEITGGYTLFVPLMIVSAIAYLTKAYFEPHSIYTKKLVEKGDLIQNDNDKQVLSLIDINKLIEKDFKPVQMEGTLGDLVEVIKVSKRNYYPVVDENESLVGILRLDDVRKIMFDQKVYESIYVKSVMQIPREIIQTTDDMALVMNKFERSGAWNLAVTEDDKYIGFISKSTIFNSYRKRIIKQHKE